MAVWWLRWRRSSSFSTVYDLAGWAGAADMESIFIEPWRLVSSTCLHLDFGHLVVNALFVAILAVGHTIQTSNRQTLCIYFLSGAGGTLAGCALKTGLFLGASGGMFGLLGANVTAMRKRMNNRELFLTACLAFALAWLNQGDLSFTSGLFGCLLEFLGCAQSPFCLVDHRIVYDALGLALMQMIN